MNFLLADEINRAPAKVQSALLEVMAEGQVTIGGQTHAVPQPFFVVATQNPIESEGVYQLPDAQRDRFMMKIVMDHPSPAEEMVILDRMAVRPPAPEQVIDLDGLVSLQRRSDRVFVDRSVAAVRRRPRPGDPPPRRTTTSSTSPPSIALGVSPRATLALVRGARALALIRGRTYATPQDVFDIAPEVLRHRLLLTYDALARDITADDVVNRVLVDGAGHLGVAEAERSGPATREPIDCVPPRRAARRRRPTRCSGRPGRRPRRSIELVRSLEVTISRRVDGSLHGNYQGITPGHGSEPGEARLYQPGDDVRRIDWNVTARTMQTHVRDQIADRDLEAWLVVDVSAAMRFGTATMEKAQVALAAAACVGFLTVRNKNRVGAVLVAGPHLKVMPPRTGARPGARHPHRDRRRRRRPSTSGAATSPAPSTASPASASGAGSSP